MAALCRLAGGFSIDSDNNTSSSDTKHTRGPSPKELDAIELQDHGKLAQKTSSDEPVSPASIYTPGRKHDPFKTPEVSKTPNELESSQPPTPTRQTAASVVPSWSYPRMNKWRILCACLIYFGNGMSDSAPGALIPYIETWYSIGYAIVSLIWIANAAGFITAAFVTDPILKKFGRARTLMGSEAFMIAAYVIISCTPPFPAVVVAYLIMGFGNAINLALNNVFCANLADSTVILGLAHGSYGVGGIVAPLIATAMVSNGIHWSRFFLITIGVRAVGLVFAGWSFWNYEKEGTTQFANSLQQLATRQNGEVTKRHLLSRALKNKTTLIGALFIFAYQGAEVSESGWFISYLINYRNGNPARVGYVTSGFWAGITLGRFTLTHVAHRIGEKRFVFAMGIGVIIFQLMCWFIPNIIGEAVSVAILGLLLGPVYPCAATVFTKLLPGNMQTIAISFISSAGSSGGAVVPFITGLIAQGAGTFVLHPICIGAYVLMLGCWVVLPKVKKRAED
ncbi:Bypass of stop codon protein 6 [Fulvia fulva]|uniref:Bypass of stop codon protein 6 n=1 Tax=Passalora fulva TaxID=5499 RepID=A0A9Q8US97_PASFU|nr:Bypass of stop codon protein 6 [Fulvia fulva]KAK4617861.1 Bypass of stop codon protein 6 [Fulvia fulva]KAK4618868.1 Bypass of stop codon protein 6 [Fulvia fulva]UJO20547.1 Bypass of stop codon protein 6 [Fulvia fulva]WPV18322.1 Bypass of stop codon protein 6 [Fulvia fulva]WPV33476.1 Bypass of stop codon protein 6 [Fulvia fulva]